MKKRIGNDISFVWHIFRKSGETQTPESFTGKDVEVKLISPLQRPVTIEDVSIATGVVTFTFRGKYQTTLGNYVAVLQENRGEDGMVTLDVVSAVSLVAHSYMEEDGDDGDVIEAEAVELTSEITAGGGGGIEQQQADWAQTDDTAVDFIKNKPNLDVYCRKDADNTHSDGVSDTFEKLVYDEHNPRVLMQADRLTVGGDSIKFYHSHRGEDIKELLLQLDDVEKIKRTATSELDGLMSAEDKQKLTDIEAVIPEQASSSNKLVDEDSMNSAIATATATYRGAFNLVTDLHLSVSATHAQIATALATAIQTADNNDYCYVQIPVADATPTEFASVERYKFNGNAWEYEYTLNNSGFTAAQWAALNSGITSGLVAKLSALPTNSELEILLNGKANTSDLANKENWDYAGDEFLVTERKIFNDIVVPKADVNPPGTYVLEGVERGKVTMRLFCYNGMMTKKNVVISNVHNGVTTVLYTYEVGYYETLEEILTLPIETGTLVFENYVINNIWQVKNIVNDYYVSRRSLSDYARLADLASVATTGSYNDLSDKPDLSGFITNSVDNLVNYYLKSETYTKTEVQQLIGAIQQFHYEVYPTLPQTGASNVLYLIGPTGSGSDKYEEYVYANNDWAKIGDTSIDLSGYVTTQALTTALADYVTSSALSTALAGKADKSEMSVVPGTDTDADKTTITLKQGTSATVLTAHQDITGKENVMPITTATGATLSAVVGNYYRLDNVGTLAITLPTIVGATKLQAITFLLACGSSALVTFAPQGSETILYQEDFALEADTTYEVTALWNGSEWTLSRVIYE